MLMRNCVSICSRLPSSTCMVTCASLPFFSVTGASPTPATSSAGSSLIPYTNVRFAIASILALKPRLNPFPPPRIYTNRANMPENTTRDTVILGSGCSGLTAAIYTARANLKPLVLEGHEPGGQLSITTLVENLPGWPEGIQGPDLIENMKKQAVRFGAELRMAHLDAIDLTKHPFALTIGKETIHTRTLIIASGASARWLNLPSEQALIGHGVSSCATCDGFFSSGKEIAVIGGGPPAMEEALFLTRFATKVTLINRTEKFRASKIMLERAIGHPKIKFLSSTTVEEVLGVEEKDVKGLRLQSLVSGDQYVLPVSFMFLG